MTMFNLVACKEANQNPSNNLEIIPEVNQSKSAITQEKLNITVSILPQKYFVEKIGGELVTVNVMVEPGAAAETYEPLPQQLVSLTKSSAYINIGVPFEESWLEKITSANANIALINSGAGIEKIPLTGHHHHDEENHELEGKTEEKEILDPHIWLSPSLAKIQAENIYQGLVKLDPQNEAIYQQNLTQFLGEIDEIDRQIKAKFASISKREFISHHPAWGYFAQDYDLTQIPLELEGQEVSSAQFVGLVKEAEADNIKVVFAQPQFNNKTVTAFAKEINGEVVILDPLAENWSQNLLDTADKLTQAMK